uniref:Uncharacterized protein n=1 Tax=Rhizophora mucronata TaxID=61149 RepID=A0A2P2QD67_RHIMU
MCIDCPLLFCCP